MKIQGKEISKNAKPYVIAEMSGNHNQSLERALEIVSAAAAAGADAIKMQTYTADTMTLPLTDGDFKLSDSSSLWDGSVLHDLYKTAHTPWDWHKPIMEHANKLGLACFSSPFDESAVEFLETLNVPAYKIASFECIDLPLIEAVARTGKPLIISTGMATLNEIDDAVRTARENGCTELALLKCTSSYPAVPINSNVSTVPHMRELFNCEIGLSDHTLGIGASIAAVSLGASIVEKHFTLDRKDGGVDSVFSLEPEELRQLVIETERAWQSLGNIVYGPTLAEVKSRGRRRSLYIAKDMVAGEVLDSDSLRRVRPGNGLSPKFYNLLLGKRVKKTVLKGTPLSWDIVL